MCVYIYEKVSTEDRSVKAEKVKAVNLMDNKCFWKGPGV